MAKESIKWFPLDRLPELELAIAELVADPKTMLVGIGCALGLHGLRVSEVTRALAKQFSARNESLYVCPYDVKLQKCQPLKHGVARTVKLHRTVCDAITAWRLSLPAARQAAQWLFPTRSGGPYKSQYFSAAGRGLLLDLGMMDDDSTRFHMFRHTCAMRILSETNDIQLVSQHLGHASIQTTMHYLDCLREVPTSCLVKLFDTPSEMLTGDQQLALFNPHEYRVG